MKSPGSVRPIAIYTPSLCQVAYKRTLGVSRYSPKRATFHALNCALLQLFFAVSLATVPCRAQQVADLSTLDVPTLQQRAQSGDAEAQAELGNRYMFSNRGVPYDPAQSFNWVQESAQQGNPRGEFLLAGKYAQPSGLVGFHTDLTVAAAWYRKSADQGYVFAELTLAGWLVRGNGECQDLPQAAMWFQKAADQGNPEAQWTVANAYEFGEGVPKDLAKAREWYQKSADQNYFASKARLQWLDSQPHVTSSARDLASVGKSEAATCAQGNDATRNLADLGDPVAEQNMGQLSEYENNYQEAARWYREAVKGGSGFSAYSLMRITVKMYQPGSAAAQNAWKQEEDAAAAVASNLGAASLTDPSTMPPSQVLTLLQNAERLKVDPKGTSFSADPRDRDLKLDLKACNGGKVNVGALGEFACLNVFATHRDRATDGISADNFYLMSVLIRGCGVYALADQSLTADGRSCGMLGRYLAELGNLEAAKAVWEAAPGCYSTDHRAGTPSSACAATILGSYSQDFPTHLDPVITYELQPERLIQLMWTSCSTVHDRPSCEFLSSNGATVDMAAVEQAENDRHDAIEENRERNQEEMQEAQAASEARRDALLGALQSMGGGNPNLIANTANQQAAAIRTIGDANAARQQQAAQQQEELRIAQQQSAASVSTAPDQAPSSNPSQASPTNATATQPSQASSGGASPAATSTASSGGTSSRLVSGLPGSCVSQFWDPQNYNWLSLRNVCNQPIYVSYIFNKPSGWAMNGGTTLAPGAHATTGESFNDISQAGGFQYYVCPANYVPVDVNGNTLSVNVTEYRCEPQ